jgi:transposase
LNGIDPQAWLGDALARINDHKITGLAALLPWHWAPQQERRRLAA